jgi:iron(III) transport system substrate-binding protein
MQTNDKEPEQQTWAESVRILFPNTNDRGSHVNIAGVILAKNAPHKDNAVKLIEFLSSGEAQEIYAETNHEYPVKPGVAVSERVASWGDFKKDTLPLADIAENRKTASELIDKVGFDDGPAS